jgi:hypothetical protein
MYGRTWIGRRSTRQGRSGRAEREARRWAVSKGPIEVEDDQLAENGRAEERRDGAVGGEKVMEHRVGRALGFVMREDDGRDVAAAIHTLSPNKSGAFACVRGREHGAEGGRTDGDSMRTERGEHVPYA